MQTPESSEKDTYNLRQNLPESLTQSHNASAKLSTFQRI